VVVKAMKYRCAQDQVCCHFAFEQHAEKLHNQNHDFFFFLIYELVHEDPEDVSVYDGLDAKGELCQVDER